MFRSQIIVLALLSVMALALASPVPDGTEVKDGMKDAFRRGLERFGGQVTAPKPVSEPAKVGTLKPYVYSLYTKGLSALGGGKPATNDRYRKHNYVGPSTTVNPVEHNVVNPDKMTAKEASEVFRPHPTYQFTTDRTF